MLLLLAGMEENRKYGTVGLLAVTPMARTLNGAPTLTTSNARQWPLGYSFVSHYMALRRPQPGTCFVFGLRDGGGVCFGNFGWVGVQTPTPLPWGWDGFWCMGADGFKAGMYLGGWVGLVKVSF